eukprot:60340-Pyramimonas_sp.AAC.1
MPASAGSTPPFLFRLLGTRIASQLYRPPVTHSSRWLQCDWTLGDQGNQAHMFGSVVVAVAEA